MTLDEAIRIVDPATRREALYIYDPEDRKAVENEARHLVAQALREKHNGGWISVKDRLPELGNGQGRNQYLVCYITPKRRKEN